MRFYLPVILAMLAAPASAGQLYYTDFTEFPVGDETIAGRNSWVGTHAGLKLYGIDSEANHQVLGLGNAAYIGGNTASYPLSSGSTVLLRRTYSYDAVADNNEVVTISTLLGIQDSTNGRRDNFEFAVYNTSGQIIGALQFDNSTMSTAPISVRVATTTNINLSGLQNIDGVNVTAGSRVLVKNQNVPAQNGIYVAAFNAWSRALEFDGLPAGEVATGKSALASEGTVNGGTAWSLSTTGTITVGATALEFAPSTNYSSQPLRNIYRTQYNSTGGSLEYTNTGSTFLHDYIHTLDMRINFRTNRWSTWLDGVAIFADQTFYSGPLTRNLGIAAVRMVVKTSAVTYQPGDNYMLFDNYQVRSAALPDVAIYSLKKTPGTAPEVTWDTEAGYSYRLEYTPDLSGSWLGLTTQSSTSSGFASWVDTAGATQDRRFYRLFRLFP